MPGQEETKRGINLDGEEEQGLPLGDNYLFVVGIDQYKSMPRLNNAVKDAREVVRVLTSKYQFDDGHLATLYDTEATQTAIIDRLKSYAKTVTEQDTLLMYFAGHGEYDEIVDVGYWIPIDGRQGEIGSYISFDLVTRLLRAIKSRHTFLITDSCYSGSFFTARRAATAADRLESLPSRWLLTAGRKEVVSDGWDGGHSPFAKAVLWHLEHNSEPRMRVSQFCNEVVIAVGNNAEQLPRGAALQNVGDMGGEFMFRLKAYKDTVFEKPADVPKTAATSRSGGDAETEMHEPEPPRPEPQAAPLRTIEDVRERLKALLRDSDFKGVFELLNRIIDDRSRRENDIIMQQSQFSSINNQMRSGLIDPNFANITLNRIRFAMTSIIDELETEDLKAGALQPQSGTGNNGGAYLDELERKGLQDQAETLQRKLNLFRQELIKAYDPNQKFALQEQIAETEKQLKEIREKLG
ncbi:MAG: caspase family protein [Phaeodactylibacter sp.]|nr:caspase family protein [Phaeodactylibacter sp.]MCB9274296.1 caspase family protein [Lewinellaceae bacterium]